MKWTVLPDGNVVPLDMFSQYKLVSVWIDGEEQWFVKARVPDISNTPGLVRNLMGPFTSRDLALNALARWLEAIENPTQLIMDPAHFGPNGSVSGLDS